MTRFFNLLIFRKCRLVLLQTFLTILCASFTIMAHAEYTVLADATYTFPPPGLVTGMTFTDAAGTYEGYTYTSASASAFFNRPVFVLLSEVASLAHAETLYTVTWKYIGGGPEGGTFSTQETCFARIQYGTSVAERHEDGTLGNVFVAFAMARSPEISCITAGHTGPYMTTSPTRGQSINLLDTNHADMFLRATVTPGPLAIAMSANANVRWTLTEIH